MKEIITTALEAQLQTIHFSELLLAIVMAFILSSLVGYVYVHCGQSLSDRKTFSNNFVLIAMATTLIIMVIKSSIALSLGLVGALSIVRFRAAIKEPEEISYLFIIIGIGIGLGAQQYILTLVSVLLIVAIVLIKTLLLSNKTIYRDYNVNIVSEVAKTVGLEELSKILGAHALSSSLKRYDEDDSSMDALFYAKFSNLAQLEAFRKELFEFDKAAKLSFLEPILN